MYKFKEKVANNKAITLISLVITIVVLLILAGVTISMISGNESIIDNAKKANDTNKLQAESEEIQAIINMASAKGIKNGNYSGSITVEEAKTAITNKFSDAQFLNNEFPLGVVIGGNRYSIDNLGEVGYFIDKEYLKSTGTQYIDTEVNPANTVDFEITFKTDVNAMTVDASNLNNAFFGTSNIEINRTLSLNFGARKDECVIYTWKNNTYTNGAAVKCFETTWMNPINKLKISCVNNVWKVNGNQYGAATSVGDWKDTDSNLIVFGLSRIRDGAKTIVPFYENMYLYSLKIWDNGELIRDFTPVISYKNGHENEPCLFDKVGNKFYYNQGSGTFETN